MIDISFSQAVEVVFAIPFWFFGILAFVPQSIYRPEYLLPSISSPVVRQLKQKIHEKKRNQSIFYMYK